MRSELDQLCLDLLQVKSARERRRQAGEDHAAETVLVQELSRAILARLPRSGGYTHAGWRFVRDRQGELSWVRLTPRYTECAAARPGRRA